MLNDPESVTAAVMLAQNTALHGNTNLELVVGMLLFGAAGFGIVFVGLLLGSFARPNLPHPEKLTAYECGEEPIGESWVQFDLRFYTVALVFIVFDVEVALLWPWAVAFKELGAPAFWAFLVFFALIAIPFFYEWHAGYLDWVRASTGQHRMRGSENLPPAGAAEPSLLETRGRNETEPRPSGSELGATR